MRLRSWWCNPAPPSVCAAVAVAPRVSHATARPDIATTSLVATGLAAAAWFGWRQRRTTLEGKQRGQKYSRFIAAAEASLDGFSILEAIRDSTGRITDFRIRYVNDTAKRLVGVYGDGLVGQTL